MIFNICWGVLIVVFSFALVDSTPCWAKPTMAWEVSQRRLFDNRSKGQLVEDMRGATQVILLIQ